MAVCSQPPTTAIVDATPFGRLRSNREYPERKGWIRRANARAGGSEAIHGETGLVERTETGYRAIALLA